MMFNLFTVLWTTDGSAEGAWVPVITRDNDVTGFCDLSTRVFIPVHNVISAEGGENR